MTDTTTQAVVRVANAVQAYSGAIPRDRAYETLLVLLAERDALAAELAELRAAKGWQPIETAPKDGTEILTCRQGALMAVATYWPHGKAFWCATDGCHLLNVTHWMPLPQPPEVQP